MKEFRSERSAWKKWKAYKEVTYGFNDISRPIVLLQPEVVRLLEKLVGILYSVDVNSENTRAARKHIFSTKAKSLCYLPPTSDALALHALCAAYQGGNIWDQAYKIHHLQQIGDGRKITKFELPIGQDYQRFGKLEDNFLSVIVRKAVKDARVRLQVSHKQNDLPNYIFNMLYFTVVILPPLQTWLAFWLILVGCASFLSGLLAIMCNYYKLRNGSTYSSIELIPPFD
uniref:Uncharacterized protein n=1 Tax=Timema cristinae TaxID=61476 RepID=A0A7R9DDV8_TIMCR|nr:unnamed protein product [Timema cristinae]